MASSPARAVGDQPLVALPADLPAHLTDPLVADLAESDASATSSLAAALAAVPDARDRRGRRHELAGCWRSARAVPDRGEVVRGDRRVGPRAGSTRARLPRWRAIRCRGAVGGDPAPLPA